MVCLKRAVRGVKMMKTYRGSQVLGVLFFGTMLLVLTGTALGQVNTEELGKGQGQVEFFNYEGPVTRIDSRAQIRDIGYTLGRAVASGALRSGSESRYFVIHGASGSEGLTLDADIFGLGASVGVDHIRNLRLIIQGYLEGAYNYAAQDANLLAQYITIYNAVYRGNWSYFSITYKQSVLRYVTPDQAGLALRFSEWPGKTLMLIPLGPGSAGSLSAIDTSSISDSQVLEELRKAEDLSIDQRKDMVAFKEREADEAEQEALRQQQAIAQEEARLAAERAALEAEQARLAKDRSFAVAAQEEAAQQREQALRDQEAALAAQREQAEQLEAFAERKREEAQQDRQGIAGDQQGLLDEGVDVQGTESTGEEPVAEVEAGEGEAQGSLEQVEVEGRSNEADAMDGGDLNDASPDEAAALEEEGSENAGEAARSTDAEAGDTEEQQQELSFEAVENAQVPGVVGIALAGSSSLQGNVVKINPASGAELKRTELNTITIRTVVLVDNQIIAVAGNGNRRGLVAIDLNTLEVLYQGEDEIHQESLLWVNGRDLYGIIVSEGNCYLARFDTTLVLQAQSEIQVHPYGTLLFQDNLLSTQDAEGKAVILDILDLLERR
jgi:hypothetical protein